MHRWGLLLIAGALASCVSSTNPAFGPDTRVLPFASPAKFELYERSDSRGSWTKKGTISFVADANLVVRESSQQRWTYTFHAFEPRRFVIQFRPGDEAPFSYGLLEIRNGEAFAKFVGCENVDQTAFRAKGGLINRAEKGDFFSPTSRCLIDNISDRLAILKWAFENFAPLDDWRLVPIK